MEELTYEPKPSTIFGIPIEKAHKYNKYIEHLNVRDHSTMLLRLSKNFIPILPNNQIYAQGYFSEILAFVNTGEGHGNSIVLSLEAAKETYQLIEKIKYLNCFSR